MTPDGTPDRPDLDPANELKGAKHAGLIDKFGASGQPFVVGSYFRSPGQMNGRLYRGVNDIDQSNDVGRLVATISLE